MFAVGCIIAELYLGNQLFSGAISSDREHLAALDRVLGPFPRAFAQTIETRFPGTFRLDDDHVKVHYPSLDTVLTRDAYGAPMRRLERMRPLSVSCCLLRAVYGEQADKLISKVPFKEEAASNNEFAR